MTEAVWYWSIRRLGEAYRHGETTPTAAARALLDRIAAEEPRLHAYAHLAPDITMAQAEAAERELAAGRDRGPLHGVPIGIKDLCATRDMPTHAGMPKLAPWMPGVDATLVGRLREAGAVISGKLQMTEGATMVHHPEVARPVNPWGPDLWTGVSSSGSGVAPAAGLCQASLGSDTGGSIRFPSSSCGLTGLKPTFGRVSLHGVFPCGESQDHVGPMARSAEDVAAVLAAIAGPDPADPATLQPSPSDYLAELAGGLEGLTLGIDAGLIGEDVDAEVSAAVLAGAEVLAGAGVKRTPIAFPRFEGALGDTIASFLAEIGWAHAETFPSQASAYGPDLRGFLQAAQTVTAFDVIRAQRARRALSRDVTAVLADVDMMILPALPFVTPSVEDGITRMRDPAWQTRAIRFAWPFDLSGHPTVTLPCGFDKRGAPIGLQLVGRRWDEARLLRAAHVFQQRTDFHARRPPL
jgi:amidase